MHLNEEEFNPAGSLHVFFWHSRGDQVYIHSTCRRVINDSVKRQYYQRFQRQVRDSAGASTEHLTPNYNFAGKVDFNGHSVSKSFQVA